MKNLFFLCFMLCSFFLSAQCDNVQRRADINNLQPFERVELNQLILDFLVSDPNPDWEDTGADFFNPFNTLIEYKYLIIGEHTQWGDAETTAANHNDEQFLSWHRYYIGKLEQYLLDQGFPQYVPLPRWRPTVAMPTEFYDAMIPEFLDYGIDVPNIAGDARFISPPELTWSWGLDAEPGTIMDICTEFDNADDLGNFLGGSGLHIPPHFDIGGAMRIQESTSGTSIFWPLHANLDEYYYCYQIECQCPIIEVSGNAGPCTYCLDFDGSVNMDGQEVILVASDGSEKEVILDNTGCFKYSDYGLSYNGSYTIAVKGKNSIMRDNIDCPQDEESLSFTVPNAPFKSCSPIVLTPFPQSDGGITFIVTNTGSGGYFNFYNTPTITGLPTDISTGQWIGPNGTITISIPTINVYSGPNTFSVQGNGESINYQYFGQ